MGYTFQSLKQVLDVFQPSSSLGVTEISGKLGKSRVIIHKYVKELVLLGKLKKIGQGPGVKYSLTESLIDTKDVPIIKENALISFQEKKLLDEIFFKFSADGHILKGYDGMGNWCEERNLGIISKSGDFRL